MLRVRVLYVFQRAAQRMAARRGGKAAARRRQGDGARGDGAVPSCLSQRKNARMMQPGVPKQSSDRRFDIVSRLLCDEVPWHCL